MTRVRRPRRGTSSLTSRWERGTPKKLIFEAYPRGRQHRPGRSTHLVDGGVRRADDAPRGRRARGWRRRPLGGPVGSFPHNQSFPLPHSSYPAHPQWFLPTHHPSPLRIPYSYCLAALNRHSFGGSGLRLRLLGLPEAVRPAVTRPGPPYPVDTVPRSNQARWVSLGTSGTGGWSGRVQVALAQQYH